MGQYLNKLSFAAFFSIFMSSCILNEEVKSAIESNLSTSFTQKIQGTWNLACYQFHPSYSTSYSIEVSGSTFVYRQNVFRGAVCASDERVADVYVQATLTDQGSLSSGTEDIHAINLIIQQQTVTPYAATSQNMVGLYNSISVCGFNDWSAGVAKDVLGGLGCNQFPAGTSYIDFSVPFSNERSGVSFNSSELVYFNLGISSSADKLYIGDISTGNGTTSGNRPTAILKELTAAYNVGSNDFSLTRNMAFIK